MKNFKIFFVFVYLSGFTWTCLPNDSLSTLTQKELIGTWQENQPLVGRGLKDVYRFYKDWSFKFVIGTTPYFFFSKFLAVYGTYKIKDGQVYLYPDSYLERTGGVPTFNRQSTYWEYKNDIPKKVVFKTREEVKLPIIINRDQNGNIEYLEINDFSFYFVNRDPDYLY